jgi:DNA adenine methylase
MNDFKYEKPIVKWVGGKTQIIDNVIEKFPTTINNYHELFLGGGSVLFALLENINNSIIKVKGNINAYDINETLINMYKNIQNNYKDVLTEIKKIINIYNGITHTIINKKPKTIEDAMTSQESYYYWIRLKFNEYTQEIKNLPIGTAYFIFLNKTCFRGLYRESKNGFNVPYGHYKNLEIINENHIKKIHKLIKNVNFHCLDFKLSFGKILNDDFVYLDPPYVPENDKSFVNYNMNGFDLKQHNLLFTLCKKYNFLMSNSDVKFVRDNFPINEFEIQTISCRRNINSKKPNSKTNEVLIRPL